ncbi:unnamed protein product [Prorocentrum cordatum]|uniref:Uncharacterized protein n=1 Tax=Prorocentrum cordatum TaxID=2364126 RepID=A0ABN9R801_9DINO|nr:unnamed protein product [Polarella glacialis]
MPRLPHGLPKGSILPRPAIMRTIMPNILLNHLLNIIAHSSILRNIIGHRRRTNRSNIVRTVLWAGGRMFSAYNNDRRRAVQVREVNRNLAVRHQFQTSHFSLPRCRRFTWTIMKIA